MFRILPRKNIEATFLQVDENIFHRALNQGEKYYHVADEHFEYDISYVKNNDLIPENYRNLKRGIEVFPPYANYDENALETLDLSLISDNRTIFIHTLNEYSMVIARLALKYTDAEVYFHDEAAKIFMEKSLSENPRLHIVKEFPDTDDAQTLQIVDGMVLGGIDGSFQKVSSVPAFHSIFFCQFLTAGLDASSIKYVDVSIAKNVGVGGIIIYCSQLKKFLAKYGWQPYINENSTRYSMDMLKKYFILEQKPQDATPKNTIYLADNTILLATYSYFKGKSEIRPIKEKVLTDRFRAEMDEYAEAVLGKKRVLGILIRGTDYIVSKMGGVRKMATVDDMLPTIRQWIAEDNYDLIFLATEDQDILDRMRKEFGKMIRVISQVRHTVKDFAGLKLLSELEDKERADNPNIVEDNTVNYFYALYLLSKCESFMAGGECNGWFVVHSFHRGRFKRSLKFQLGVK